MWKSGRRTSKGVLFTSAPAASPVADGVWGATAIAGAEAAGIGGSSQRSSKKSSWEMRAFAGSAQAAATASFHCTVNPWHSTAW